MSRQRVPWDPSLIWYAMTFEDFDSYVDWLDFGNNFPDWLQNGIQQNYNPPIAKKKASHIRKIAFDFDVNDAKT